MSAPTEAPLVLAPALRDGFEVHQAALSHGLAVTLLPRQVMTVTTAHGSGELSFVHGVPESSNLSAVTFAQDKRIRRALLRDAGLPVPKGGTFSIGRGRSEAREQLLAHVGYPMVVKSAVGDNVIEVLDGIQSDDQLHAAIDYFWTPAIERPAFVRAAYSLTETRELGEIDGKVVAPPGYRVLVEQQVSGHYLRFVVIGGDVRSVLHCPGGPWNNGGHQPVDVTSRTHASLCDMAVQASRAVPGLAVAAVDIVAARGHDQDVRDQDVWIVELSERPWLTAQARVSEQLSAALGKAILTSYAADAGFSLTSTSDSRDLHVHIDGLTAPLDAAPKIEAAGREAGLSVQLDVTDEVVGTLDGSISGSARATAWWSEMLMDGQLAGTRAMLIEENQAVAGT